MQGSESIDVVSFVLAPNDSGLHGICTRSWISGAVGKQKVTKPKELDVVNPSMVEILCVCVEVGVQGPGYR